VIGVLAIAAAFCGSVSNAAGWNKGWQRLKHCFVEDRLLMIWSARQIHGYSKTSIGSIRR